MDMNQYQALARRTSNKNLTDGEHLINGALGLAGESGEVADLVKKAYMQGHKEIDRSMIVKELGDVLWYIAETAAAIGCDLESIAQRNIDKLRNRYPDGFDAERSMKRPEYEHAEKTTNTGGSTSAFLFEMRNKTI